MAESVQVRVDFSEQVGLLLVKGDKPVGFEVLDQGGEFEELCRADLVPEVYVLVDELLCKEH